MDKGYSAIRSLLLIILCLNSLIYYNAENSLVIDSVPNSTTDSISTSNIRNEDNREESKIDAFTPVKKIDTPGNYQVKGYFFHDTMINIDEDGLGWEFEPYEDIKDDGLNSLEIRPRFDSTEPVTYPPDTVNYYRFTNPYNPSFTSNSFTPVFSEETYIDGKVYFLFHVKNDWSVQPVIDFRIRVFLFNPSNNSKSLIFTIEDNNIDYYISSSDQNVYSYTLSSPYTIPAGHRLKIVYDGTISRLDGIGEFKMYCSNIAEGNQYTWEINDGPYSNIYTIADVNRIMGIQFYMNNDYPEISVTGFTNETRYYNESKDITINVSGAEESSYRFNSDTYTSFNDSIIVQSPEEHGWHYLYVQAIDDYNNNRTLIYQIGNDLSLNNVLLNSPSNNTVIGDGEIIDFDIFNVDSATYEWDNGGENPLNAPYDIIAPDITGYHNLTIRTTDVFEVLTLFYVFEIDNSPPVIVLDNVTNDTFQPAGKRIDVDISDQDPSIIVFYNWDSKDNFSWSPTGDTYSVSLPDSEGDHWLNVYANDSLGHFSSASFTFYTDPNTFYVELRNMENDSYYYGENIVEITISGSNGTVTYKWDSGIEKDGTIQNATLVLNGSDVLPSSLGVHILTVKVVDLFDVVHNYVYVFTIDQENPEISISIYTYHNQRFNNSYVFYFDISDNFTDGIDYVLISIDNGANQTLSEPYKLLLEGFIEGIHNFTLYVFDKALNFDVAFIIFTIDSSSPTIDIQSILGLFELADGSKYVPANSIVTCNIADDDSAFISTYSWNNSEYQIFNQNFVLGAIEGTATLIVNASDSIGNHHFITLELTIDNTAPNITISFPLTYSSINDKTSLTFLAEDLSVNNIHQIEYYWDIFPVPFLILPDALGYFSFNLDPLFLNSYSQGDFANLTIVAEDIVGNIKPYLFSFIIDKEAPKVDLYNDEVIINNYLDPSETHYIRGNETLIFQILDLDMSSFTYYWDGVTENETQLLFPWILFAPILDGNHTLTIIIKDDTGEGTSPNQDKIIYKFIIDDVKIDYVSPSDFSDNYFHSMEYGDSLTFVINITDGYDSSEIKNITYSIIKDTAINLNIVDIQLDNITYQFTILATNITYGDNTAIEIQFWQFENHKQSTSVHLQINRKEGNIILLSNPRESVMYGDTITISLNLNDNLNISAQLITQLKVNGTSVSYDINYSDLSIQFSFSTSRFTDRKGNYTLDIYVESNFYYDSIVDSSVINVEILPIPVILTVSVSNFTIIEGTQLVITGNLTYYNGTPIPNVQLLFYIYIYYKNVSNNVNAFVPEYFDLREILTGITDLSGLVTVAFEMTEDVEYVIITGEFIGDDIKGKAKFILDEEVFSIPAPGIQKWLLYTIIAGSILLFSIISFVIYKLTRPKPFEQLMSEVEDEEIFAKLVEISPGVFINIFDQTKGAIPIVTDHNLDGIYNRRLTIGVDNFLLKIADQAYSSLGFEDHHDRRRIGSILLPNEGMVGLIHGIQLPNVAARGGFENLTLIVLVNEVHDTGLLGNQVYLFDEIDELILQLKERKPLEIIKEQLRVIRNKATRIVLASLIEEPLDSDLLEK